MKKLYILMFLAATAMSAQGSLCTDPIVINALPFSTSDNTANYLDSYDPQTETHPSCSTTVYGNYYHGGNDVIYSYTPSASGSIKVEIPSALAWTGMFIYDDCADIGVSYLACATGATAGVRVIDNFAVTAGTTYYIFISSWPAPQTVAYTLNVTNLTLGVAEFTQVDVKLYPNPVAGSLSVSSDRSFAKATVYNVNGEKIEMPIANNTIDTSNLQSGFYILELTLEDGSRLRKNFIKSGN